MWDSTPAPQANQPEATKAAPLRRDLTAMMYSGATPLFDTGALDDEEPGDSKPSKTDKMFEDESDDAEDFLGQLTKPAEEQKVNMQIGAGGAAAGVKGGPKPKPKSNNPFGSSSDDDDDFGAKVATGGGY